MLFCSNDQQESQKEETILAPSVFLSVQWNLKGEFTVLECNFSSQSDSSSNNMFPLPLPGFKDCVCYIFEKNKGNIFYYNID